MSHSNQLTQLPSLERAYKVDEVINTKGNNLVIIRFARENSEDHKELRDKVDGWLRSWEQKHLPEVLIYTVNMSNVPELVARYQFSEPVTLLFFHDRVQARRRLQGRFTEAEVDAAITEALQKVKDKKPPAKTSRPPTQPPAKTSPPPTRPGPAPSDNKNPDTCAIM